MKVTYIGRYDEVEIPALDGLTVKNGETITIPPADAEGFLSQVENWRPADDAAKKVTKALAPTDPPPADPPTGDSTPADSKE